jgi:hypothetical protein
VVIHPIDCKENDRSTVAHIQNEITGSNKRGGKKAENGN